MSTQPLLPTHRALSKGKGKARAPSSSSSGSSTPPRKGFRAFDEDEPEEDEERGRCVTIRFTGDQGGDLDVWVEEGESVGSVKEKIRVLRPTLQQNSLRFIHSGRLLTDGILLLPWLRALENRLQSRQDAEDIGLAGVVRGLAGEADEVSTSGKGKGKEREEKVWLHCVVGAKAEEGPTDAAETTNDDNPISNRRGFDSLLDAGFTTTEIAAMRREFYLSRGQEIPDEFVAPGGTGDGYEEHVRALEEQWIEGDLNNETAETVNEGLYSSIFHGILISFLFPLLPWFFFREIPSPNFFDPLEGPDAPLSPLGEAETRLTDADSTEAQASINHESQAEPSDASNMFGLRGLPGGDWRTGVVFGQRTQMAILIGTVLNVGFAGLRFLA